MVWQNTAPLAENHFESKRAAQNLIEMGVLIRWVEKILHHFYQTHLFRNGRTQPLSTPAFNIDKHLVGEGGAGFSSTDAPSSEAPDPNIMSGIRGE